jgi:hypothetical protein
MAREKKRKKARHEEGRLDEDDWRAAGRVVIGVSCHCRFGETPCLGLLSLIHRLEEGGRGKGFVVSRGKL